MLKLLRIIFIIFFYSGLSLANENLSKCKGSNYSKWKNCYGEAQDFKTQGNLKINFYGSFGNSPGKRDGYGISEVYKDNKLQVIYEGEFKNDVPNGVGSEFFPISKIKTVGRYVNGDLKYAYNSYPQGDVYIGPVKSFKRQGIYFVRQADGKEGLVSFENDNPIKQVKYSVYPNVETEARNFEAKAKSILECRELGFKMGVKDFSDCSMQLFTLYKEEALETQKIKIAERQARAAKKQAAASRKQAEAAEKQARASRQKNANTLMNKGMKMLSGNCTLGINC
tara:strand:- start:517 stop:1362 length:846 start_codon:yes stop_codon:yes gene_type:complete